ncbi:MAG: hypothetical protein AAF211_20615, partial [Myxococcota bacterium]
LVNRIEERFPESSLLSLCKALHSTAEATRRRANRIARPNLGLRAAVALVLVSAFAGFGWVTGRQITEGQLLRSLPVLDASTLEAGANLLIIAGTAIWFLVSLEERMRRQQILDRLHELRSLAHIVDMHQLTKDPTVLLDPVARTPSSPVRNMSAFELGRYLDYCTEMLSIIGKLAAIYGERSRDTQVLASVNDVETLTTALGRKVWQKIMLVHEPSRQPEPDLGDLPTRLR